VKATEVILSVRVRFAPSPTGHLHVGNVRTALFNWLFARQNKGMFVLRVEDTDLERSRPEYEEMLMQDLRWLGLFWDEGPDVGGEFGSYRQSDRLDIYKKYAHEMLHEGKAYYCFCSDEELEREREESKTAGHAAYIYSGKCRSITRNTAGARIAAGESAAIRLWAREGTVIFEDMVFGRNEKATNLLGDFVIVRKDGMPLYNFVVVIDDILMKITHVIRGDGHLPNTPKQILIYEALGVQPPTFAHLSTVLGEDGEKLSKRHGAVSVAEFRTMGYLPDALVNHMALLGWAPSESDKEVFTRGELIAAFDLTRVNKSPAVFDRTKLNFFNRTYIKMLNSEEQAVEALAFLRAAGKIGADEPDQATLRWLGHVMETIVNYIDTFSQIDEATNIIFQYNASSALESAEIKVVMAEPGAIDVVQNLVSELPQTEDIALADFKAAVNRVKEKTKQKGKALFHPIRAAVTGRTAGPELDKLVPIFESGKHLNLPVPVIGVRDRLSQFLTALETRNEK